jgi:hypothetical protein
MDNSKKLARRCFDHYLKETYPLLHRNWTPGEGPPDYYLEVGSHRLAVQVGVLEGRSDTDGGPFFEGDADPSDVIDRELELAKRIGSAAAMDGMRGTYGISLSSSAPGVSSDATQQEIIDKALDYIQNTQEATVPLPGRAYDGSVLVASIEKLADRADSAEVVRLRSLNHSYWGERGDEAYATVRRALFGAQRALSESPTTKTSLPVVLLLLDTWLHGYKALYQGYISVSELRGYWHSIFVVEEARKGYFPVDENQNSWMRLAE